MFQVGSECDLTHAADLRSLQNPDDIQVSPDGSCLAVASPNENRVAMYNVRGGFPQIVGISPVPGPGVAAGLDFSSGLVGSQRLYIGKAQDQQTVVTHFAVSSGCALTNPVVTEEPNGGLNSNVVKLSPNNDCLFVPNQGGGSSTAFWATEGKGIPAALGGKAGMGTLTTFAVDPTSGGLTWVGTFPGAGPLASAAVFASLVAGELFDEVFYTNTFDPRQVVHRGLVRGKACTPDETVTAVGTDVPGAGLLRGIGVVVVEQ